MKNSTRTQKLALCGVLTALAMIFGYIESVISVPLPVPGIKVGLPNIAIITILYVVGIKEAVAVNLIRITLTAVLFGNLNSFLFSMSGAVLSMIIMIILKKIQFFSSVGVSVAGGVLHNIGQIIAAVFIMGSGAIVYYLPVLMITGTVTGAVIGIVIYAIIAYITCPRKENGSFEEGAVALYIIIPVVVLAIYLICNNFKYMTKFQIY